MEFHFFKRYVFNKCLLFEIAEPCVHLANIKNGSGGVFCIPNEEADRYPFFYLIFKNIPTFCAT